MSSVGTGTTKYEWCINIFRLNVADWNSDSNKFSDILVTNILAS